MKNPFSSNQHRYDGSFLPEDYVARRAEVRANFFSLTLFGIVVFSIVAAFFVSNRQWTTIKVQREIVTAEFSRAKREIDQLQELERQKAEMLEKAEITTSLIERVPRSVLLSQLVSRMPEEITLLDLKLENKKIKPQIGAPRPNQVTRGTLSRGAGNPAQTKPKLVATKYTYTITIKGVTSKNEYITDYLSSLNACDLLDMVNIKHIKEKKMDDVVMREFEITAIIRHDADARSVKSPEQLRQGSEAIKTKRLSNAARKEK